MSISEKSLKKQEIKVNPGVNTPFYKDIYTHWPFSLQFVTLATCPTSATFLYTIHHIEKKKSMNIKAKTFKKLQN